MSRINFSSGGYGFSPQTQGPRFGVKWRQVEQTLVQHGFWEKRQTGSHRIFGNEDGDTVIVSGHGNTEVPKGTFSSIVHQSGLDKADFSKKGKGR